MRRLIIFALLTIFPASLPLAAQHGGGHGSAGGHGGFSSHGGFGGSGRAGGAFAGGHSGSSFTPRSFVGGSSARPSSRIGFSSRGLNSRNFNRGLGFRSHGLRNYCYGYRCGYGYGYPWLGGAFDPYWGWDSGSYYDDDQQNQIGLANEMNAQSLNDQRMYDQRMRQQGDQDMYARSAPAPMRQPVRQEDRTEVVPPTVLVFRDQHKQEVQNYAIVGQTLWNFSAQHTEKIPLPTLDLPATTKANEDRGVDFRLPGANEGQ